MVNITLEAPWMTYYKKVVNLFEKDPDIVVGEMEKGDEDDAFDYIFNIEVYNHEKYVALDRVMNTVVEFGNVTLGIDLFDMQNNSENETLDLFKTIFDGNGLVKDIQDVVDPAGYHHGYVRFKPEVIQFFDDDLRDMYGNWSGLAQDIAREVFPDAGPDVNFCTALVNEYEKAEDKPE